MMASAGMQARVVALLLTVAMIAATSCSQGAAPRSTVMPASATADGEGGRTTAFQLTSTAFANGSQIPKEYTCEGQDRSPQLAWKEPPAGTRSLALITEDPDAPGGTWVHWVLYNVPADTVELPAGVQGDATLPNGAFQGRNDFGKTGYGGPCPPQGPAHRYFFRLYALDGDVSLKPGAGRQELVAAMNGHVLGQTDLMGRFSR